MVSDSELLYLYRQGNEFALYELTYRYKSLIGKYVAFYRNNLKDLGFDEAECLSMCLLCFNQSIDMYSETKNALFSTYFYLRLQYTIKEYCRRLYRFVQNEFSYEAIDQRVLDLIMQDHRLNPERMMLLNDRIEELYKVANESIGIEKEVAQYLLMGYTTKDIERILSHDKRAIDNAIYRLRKKMRFIGQ